MHFELVSSGRSGRIELAESFLRSDHLAMEVSVAWVGVFVPLIVPASTGRVKSGWATAARRFVTQRLALRAFWDSKSAEKL